MEEQQEQKQKEQKDDFINKQQADILEKKFNCKHPLGKDKKAKIIDIIDDFINLIKTNDGRKKYTREYWFTKQIEEWKKNNNNVEPNDDKLMDIVKEDLKVRIANTMLEFRKELKKQKDIKKKDIWFYKDNDYVVLKHNDDDIFTVSFDWFHCHISPPYKPFFMKNKNDDNKLNGVCIYKRGDDKSKTKWIVACFENKYKVPQFKITFQTDEHDKITKVEIETKKDENGESTYTISLNEAGKVKKITKKGEEQNANQNYTEEIKQLLFEDNTNKHLTENIELELDNQQKEVFENIKQYIGVNEKEEKKEEEEEKKDEEEEEKKDEEEEEEEEEEQEEINSWKEENKEEEEKEEEEEQEEINSRNEKNNKSQDDTGSKKDITTEETEEASMCNGKCWNNLKSWCKKLFQ